MSKSAACALLKLRIPKPFAKQALEGGFEVNKIHHNIRENWFRRECGNRDETKEIPKTILGFKAEQTENINYYKKDKQ